MNTIYFIDEATLKANTTISLNVEPTLLNLAISDAQDMRIQSALGSNLYEKIKTLITSGDIATAPYAAYKTLLDNYIIPATIHWSLTECLNYVRYKIMNKGVMSQNSDNSNAVELEELKYLQQNIMNKAEFKQERLIEYLIDNRTLFSEYTASNDDIAPESGAYFSGMQLDDETDCDRWLGLNKNNRTL